MTDIRRLIHAVDPYEGFQPEGQPFDCGGWGGDTGILRKVVSGYRPHRIVEVGTWKGQSAINMAKEVRNLGLGCEIICVDTWLGAEEFWRNHGDEKRYQSLRLKHGYPQVYYTFLANVVREQLQGIITPFPLVSTQAAILFRKWQQTADVVYIDASHDKDAVLADCRAWAPIATQLLFGHDIRLPGVREAIPEYRKECEKPFAYREDHDWWFMDFTKKE